MAQVEAVEVFGAGDCPAYLCESWLEVARVLVEADFVDGLLP